MKIGIIGAGAAGLSAAFDLSAKGHKVVVYESAPFIGGQASTIPVGGKPLERGYHHLFTNDDAILDLMSDLHRNKKSTIALVTHEPDVAKKAERIIVMDDGKIIKDSLPAL